jgi:hypothetical protein
MPQNSSPTRSDAPAPPEARLQNEIAHGQCLLDHGAGEIWNRESSLVAGFEVFGMWLERLPLVRSSAGFLFIRALK